MLSGNRSRTKRVVVIDDEVAGDDDEEADEPVYVSCCAPENCLIH
jgi:hypothetical protein